MNNIIQKQILITFSNVVALIVAGHVHAQSVPANYPAKAVRLVVPFPAGGGVDVTARILAQQFTTRTGQSFIVDNRAGASGIIGTEFVTKAAPDGYTMLVGSQTTHCVVPAIYKVNYSTVRDLTGVTEIAKSPMLLLVHPQLPVKSPAELIQLAKQRPGQLTYGAAHGATIHMAAELMRLMAKIDILLIPYKGEGPAIVDVMGGQVMFMFSNMPVSLPQVQSGRLRVLGVTSAQRVPTLPNVPAIAESGLPGYEAATWFGMFAPTAVQREIVARLNADAVAGLSTPEVKERMAGQGYFVVASGVDAFNEFIGREIPRWAKVVRDANIKPQ